MKLFPDTPLKFNSLLGNDVWKTSIPSLFGKVSNFNPTFSLLTFGIVFDHVFYVVLAPYEVELLDRIFVQDHFHLPWWRMTLIKKSPI